jgi:membrane-bound lytic murein transglycosylase B
MDRRVFLVLLLAGCADTSANAPLAPSVTPTAPLPPPQPLPDARSSAPPVSGQVVGFDTWLAAFKQKALAAGLTQQLLDRELDGVTPDPKVISLDGASRNSPSRSATISRA